MISHEALLSILHYDPETGVFKWIVGGSGIKPHQEPGSDHNHGYRSICINQKSYLAHRLAWFYVHGKWPTNEIDHINRDKKDNRICNLREVTSSENKRNKGPSKRNSSGVPGVYWREKYYHWEASICVNKKQMHLGCFPDKETAIRVRREAEARYGFVTNENQK